MRTPDQRGVVGSWLVEQRMARGWKTARMARAELERIGGIRIAPSVYAEWESGGRQPSEANLARLVEFYGTSPAPAPSLADAVRDLVAELREMREERQQLVARVERLEAVMPPIAPEVLDAIRALESSVARGRLQPLQSRQGTPKE